MNKGSEVMFRTMHYWNQYENEKKGEFDSSLPLSVNEKEIEVRLVDYLVELEQIISSLTSFKMVNSRQHSDRPFYNYKASKNMVDQTALHALITGFRGSGNVKCSAGQWAYKSERF